MKNYSTFLTRKQLNKMISAHNDSVAGCAIPEALIKELNECKLGHNGRYLANLEISDTTKKFIDDFITDCKDYEKTGEGSIYARNFIEN